MENGRNKEIPRSALGSGVEKIRTPCSMSQDAEMTTNPPTAASAQSRHARNEATPMTTRQPHIDRFAIDHGVSNAPPPRQLNVQQVGTAYIWHSTTQELLPILPKDHPDYEENANMVMAAIRRWNKGRSR
jgi:hypothetical protein